MYKSLIVCALLFFAEQCVATEQLKQPQLLNLPSKESLLTPKDTDMSVGVRNAKIVLIEYSSLACPHCADFHAKAFPELKLNYFDTGLVLYIHRHFSTNKPSLAAAMLTICSGKYFEFSNALFISQESWAFTNDFEAPLRNIAKLSGMENDSFNKCMADSALRTSLYNDAFVASKALDLYATPVFFINGERIDGSGSYEMFSKKIERLLLEKK